MKRPICTPMLTALLCLIGLTAGPRIAASEPIDFAQVDPAEHTFDDWYLDTIDDRPSGYWRAWLAIEDDHIVTGYEEVGVEAHEDDLMHTRTRVVWTETQDFRPVTIVVENQAGSESVTQTYRFTDDGIELTSEQNGRSIKRTLPPIKGDYLTSAQQAIATVLRIKRGDEAFELLTLDPLVGMKPYTTRFKKLDGNADPFELADGSEIDATRWTITYSILPGFETLAQIDDKSNLVGLSYDLGEMVLVSRLADEKVSDTIFDPPDMAGLSVVVPDRPIKNVQRQRKIVYELSYEAGEADVVPITTAHQTVEKLGPGRVRVTVDLDADPAANNGKQDRPTQANHAATIMVDHEDPAVRELAAKALRRLKEDRDASDIALACKRAVTRHLNEPTLAVGDATASEAARTGRGDCTECAVLLAALLRANDIPSRCVTGLVYSEEAFAGQRNAFVYHMWTQAWIAPGKDDDNAGRWIDLDPAMWRYSAGHIALGVSDMGDDDQADLIGLIPMMRGLEIKVIDAE